MLKMADTQEQQNIFVEIFWVFVSFYKAIFVAVYRAIFGGPQKSVENEKVLITGAGSGLGRLMSICLAEKGAEIIAWDVSKHGLEETAKLVKEKGGKVHTYEVDVRKLSTVQKAAEKVKLEVGDVDILINNAGVVTGKSFLECSEEEIIRTFEVNVMSHFWTTQCFLPNMTSRNHGHIVNIASIAGHVGANKMSDYCASKFADVGFSETLTMELAAEGKDGVHVTCVCPYYINTGMFEGCETRFPRILPILDQDKVSKRIIKAVLTNQKILYIPRIMYLLVALKSILPSEAGMVLHNFFGGNNLMDRFVGRQKSE